MKNLKKTKLIALSFLAAFALAGCSGDDGSNGVTTVTNEDKSPPVVLSTLPVAGSSSVTLNSAFSMTFSEAIDASSVTDALVLLSGGGSTVSGSVTTSTNGITFAPQNDLSADQVYTLPLKSGVKDLAGNALAVDSSWTFTTGSAADNVAPTVVSVTPTDGGNDVGVNTILTVAFDEPMDAATLNSVTIRFNDGATSLSGSVEATGTGVAFTPSDTLKKGSLYTAVVTNGATDLAGNPLATDYSWSFSTESDVDITPPTVVLSNPQDGHEVPYLTSRLSAYFSEEMTASTITDATFTLKNVRGEVDGTVSYTSAKATFDITDQRLDLRSRYTATITDFVEDSNGLRMANDHSWEFITLDGTWQSPLLLESDDAGDAVTPQVAIDGSGNAIAVWSQFDGTRSNIYVNHFDAASGLWQGRMLIKTNKADDAYSPQIAVNTDGNAIAVWQQYNGNEYSIYANHFDATLGAWQGATLIEGDAGDASHPQIAMDGIGNAMAVWQQYDGTYDSIYGNYFRASTGWTTARLIERDDTGKASYPQVAVNASGHTMVVWELDNGTDDSIYASRYSSSLWGTATLLDNGSTDSATAPRIAIDTDGNAIAVWHQYAGSEYSIYANRFDAASGAWQGDALIENDNVGGAYGPKVAMDGSGNAMAVWQQYDRTSNNILANRFDAISGVWQNPVLIESDNAGDAYNPQIAVNDSGNAVAVWRQDDGSHYNIWANRFDAISGVWQNPALIESDNAGDASSPQVAVDGSGNAVAVWRQDDGTRANIYTNRFE